MTLDIAESLRICEAATKGPLEVAFGVLVVDRDGHTVAHCPRDMPPTVTEMSAEDARRNAAFFAHARTAFPQALRELEAARGVVERAQEMVLSGFENVGSGLIFQLRCALAEYEHAKEAK